MILDTSNVRLEKHRDLMEHLLNEGTDRLESELQVIGRGEQFGRFGIQSFVFGQDDLARRLLRQAKIWMSEKVEPEGALQYEKTRIEEAAPPPIQLPENGSIVSHVITLGFGPFEDAQRWLSYALCSWLLDRVHDADSFRRSADLEDRHYRETKDDSASFHSSLDGACPVFHHAGLDELCLEYLSRSPRFTPPEKPTSVKTERSMAYILSRHRLEGFWSKEQVDRAMSTFLKINVPKWTRGHWDRLALWMKIAFWREGQKHPTSQEALLKCYDYLPDVVPPI